MPPGPHSELKASRSLPLVWGFINHQAYEVALTFLENHWAEAPSNLVLCLFVCFFSPSVQIRKLRLRELGLAQDCILSLFQSWGSDSELPLPNPVLFTPCTQNSHLGLSGAMIFPSMHVVLLGWVVMSWEGEG